MEDPTREEASLAFDASLAIHKSTMLRQISAPEDRNR